MLLSGDSLFSPLLVPSPRGHPMWAVTTVSYGFKCEFFGIDLPFGIVGFGTRKWLELLVKDPQGLGSRPCGQDGEQGKVGQSPHTAPGGHPPAPSPLTCRCCLLPSKPFGFSALWSREGCSFHSVWLSVHQADRVGSGSWLLGNDLGVSMQA